MKVGFIIIVYNLSSEIFLLQMDAIKRFCKDEDYEIEIVDNSSNEEMAEGIRYHAQILEINYTRTFSSTKDSSDSHCFASNFSYKKFKDWYELFGYLDHDLIPLKPFSVKEILGDKMMAGLGQHGGLYMWPGCLFFKKMDDIDFGPNHQKGFDTGGNLYKTIERIGKKNCIFFNERYFENPYYRKEPYNYYAEINDSMFFHAVGLSNWIGLKEQDHTNRVNSLLNILREKIGTIKKEEITIIEDDIIISDAKENRKDIYNLAPGEADHPVDTSD